MNINNDINLEQHSIYKDFVKQYNITLLSFYIDLNCSVMLFSYDNLDIKYQLNKDLFIHEISIYFDCLDIELINICSDKFLLSIEF